MENTSFQQLKNELAPLVWWPVPQLAVRWPFTAQGCDTPLVLAKWMWSSTGYSLLLCDGESLWGERLFGDDLMGRLKSLNVGLGMSPARIRTYLTWALRFLGLREPSGDPAIAQPTDSVDWSIDLSESGPDLSLRVLRQDQRLAFRWLFDLRALSTPREYIQHTLVAPAMRIITNLSTAVLALADAKTPADSYRSARNNPTEWLAFAITPSTAPLPRLSHDLVPPEDSPSATLLDRLYAALQAQSPTSLSEPSVQDSLPSLSPGTPLPSPSPSLTSTAPEENSREEGELKRRMELQQRLAAARERSPKRPRRI